MKHWWHQKHVECVPTGYEIECLIFHSIKSQSLDFGSEKVIKIVIIIIIIVGFVLQRRNSSPESVIRRRRL